jgi:hypothetical protein
MSRWDWSSPLGTVLAFGAVNIVIWAGFGVLLTAAGTPLAAGGSGPSAALGAGATDPRGGHVGGLARVAPTVAGAAGRDTPRGPAAVRLAGGGCARVPSMTGADRRTPGACAERMPSEDVGCRVRRVGEAQGG